MLLKKITRIVYNPKYYIKQYNTYTLPEKLKSKVKNGQLIMDNEYLPSKVESGWYNWWQTQDYFTYGQSKVNEKDNEFIMLSPPPNVTGKLHIGHALTFSIQDMIARYYRMKGKKVKWIPGTDHAGIGTQAVVEKKIFNERELTRHDITKQELLKEIWNFKNEYGDVILEQIKRLGCSMDWDNLFFTLDETRTKAVNNAFIQLFEQGLIYRSTRIVNWCPNLETVISDIEVENEIIEQPTFIDTPGYNKKVEFGVMHHINYKLHNQDSYLTVATTRPETILGDIALAVHPEDIRYKHLIGQHVQHPIIKDKLLPIISDNILVDPELGTGVVKITPANDINDFESYKRNQNIIQHNILDIFDNKGYIINNKLWKDYIGLYRYDARFKIIEELKHNGLYIKKVKVSGNTIIPRCSRSKDVIEPRLKPQWYIKMKDMSTKAKLAIENKEIQIIPNNFEMEWNRWMNNLHDWCISRQLVWGHKIPVYQININSDIKLNDIENQMVNKIKDKWFAGNNHEQVFDKIRECLIKLNFDQLDINEFLNNKCNLVQDEDVLDTWFSSGLLPLSAFGWDNTNNIPIKSSNLIETGSDILFFWISRMVMLSQQLNNNIVPFKKVLLHPMIRDKLGRKMSKSLGNVIDPLNLIDGITLDQLKLPIINSKHLSQKEIQKSLKNLNNEYPNGIQQCGTDALRFCLINYLQQGRQININIDNVISAKHFGNKIWNMILYFINKKKQYNISTNIKYEDIINNTNYVPKDLLSKYLLSKMFKLVQTYNNNINNYELFNTTIHLRTFIYLLCDVGIEFSKLVTKQEELVQSFNSLDLIVDVTLKLLHPIMPFISEELYHSYNFNNQNKVQSLMIATIPDYKHLERFNDDKAEEEFEFLLNILHKSRSLKQSHHLLNNLKFSFYLNFNNSSSNSKIQLIENYKDILIRMSNMQDIIIHNNNDISNHYSISITNNITLSLPIPNNPEHYDKNKLQQQMHKIQVKLEVLNKKKDNLLESVNKLDYNDRVPEKVRQKDTKRLNELEEEIKNLENNLTLVEKCLGVNL